ncbi:DUF4380 domain-containing protein [Mycobacterium sp. 21AC1]|uniref:DUF4380 domain-containing protein n=1 Tax=[Mycobacterium] appelbergii TaxID=2939269 RepID=UPI0029394F62|nr:DUF4380 domain-containing protein [Mycobacterium sp. 21AC1]MDV3128059.1 DUF4380 domain-containing protein [Mycobacterium sp. 21AC1]
MTGAVPRTWVTHGHHDVHWIQTGVLTVGVVPDLGGRLLSLRIGGRELLWRNPALLDDDLQPVHGHVPGPMSGTLGDWRNYGGDKTWPAPQGWSSPREWAGPPDPVLDSGRYAVEVRPGGDATTELSMTSRPDPRTGLQITRAFAVSDDTGFTLRLSAVNTTDREVTWALWNVTQLAGGGTVEVGVGQRFTEPAELVIGTGVPSWQRTDTATVTIGPQDVVGKLGFPHASGTVRYRHRGASLTWNFPVDDEARYPDGGSRAEVWLEHPQPEPLAGLDGLDPPDRIVECEVLSPSRTLAPGATMTLEVKLTVQLSADLDEEL